MKKKILIAFGIVLVISMAATYPIYLHSVMDVLDAQDANASQSSNYTSDAQGQEEGSGTNIGRDIPAFDDPANYEDGPITLPDGSVVDPTIGGGHGYGDYGMDTSEVVINREDYSDNISYEDMLRYGDKYYAEQVFLADYTVEAVISDRRYIVSKDPIIGNKEYMIFDDSLFMTSEMNALEGDIVSIYGKYTDISIIDFTDGSSMNVPVVTADRFIVNSVAPDPEVIAKDFIECLNTSKKAYSNENEWIEGAKIKVLCSSDMFYNMTVNQTYPENAGLCPYSRSDQYDGFYMDGYRIKFVDENGQLAFNLQEGVDRYWVTGTLSVYDYGYDIGGAPQYALIMDVEEVEW